MIHPLRHTTQALLVAAAIVLAFALAVAAPAQAKGAKGTTPCWKTLINDWYDGRIDGTYPIHCYRDALNHLPADVDTYSSARDDIKQALQKRITQSHNGTKGGGSTPSGPGTKGGGPTKPGSSPKGPFSDAIKAGRPVKADSLPIPLLVLGGVALLLMAAGGAGFVVRRTRLRRVQVASAAAFPQGSSPRGSD